MAQIEPDSGCPSLHEKGMHAHPRPVPLSHLPPQRLTGIQELDKTDVETGGATDTQTPSDNPRDSKDGESNVPEPSPYDKFPSHRKHIMVAVMAWCGVLSPISSTTVLSAIPEVAATFNTTGSMISLSNAMYLVFMALSTCIWGPLCSVLGRRLVRLLTPLSNITSPFLLARY